MAETILAENWLHQRLDADATLASLAPCQLVSVGAASGGTFTLTYGAQTTAAIAYNAPAIGTGSVQSALQALSSIGAANVMVTAISAGNWLVTLLGSLQNVTTLLTGSGAGLIGGALAIAARARMYVDLAPQGAPFPYILATCTDPGRDVVVVGAIRIATNPLYVVRGIAQGQQYSAALQQIADRVDVLLHRQSGAITGGGYMIASYRISPFRLPENNNGVQYRHLGGQYQTLVQP